MTDNGSKIIRALEAAWGVVQKRHPDVPAVVFITGSGKALKGGDRWGRFGVGRWNTADGRAPELFMAGELLTESGGVSAGQRVLATMLHEAAHGVAHVRGIKDCSRSGNRYHNRRFATIAAELGLTVPERRDAGHGYAFTALGEYTAQAYAETIAALDTAALAYLGELTRSTTAGEDQDDENTAGEAEGQGNKRRAGQRFAVDCQCDKPRRLQITPKQHEEAPILCGACGERFEPVKDEAA
jgi:hypothetical protein